MAIPNHKEVSLSVDLLSNPDQVLGAGDRTDPTPFTSLFVNLNLGHGLITAVGLRLEAKSIT